MHMMMRSAVSMFACASLCLLSACATKPAPKEPAPWAAAAAGQATFKNQHELALPFVLAVHNPRASAMRIEVADCRLAVDGEAEPLVASALRGTMVEAGGSAEATIAFAIDERTLAERVVGRAGPSRAAFCLSVRVVLSAGDGGGLVASAEAKGYFPVVREPLFRITSIRIERDLLVTTNLRLGLEIENPNDFPLEFRSFVYDFYGEGKIWVDGASKELVAVPARGKAEIGLRFEMNFADMDRRLFDLVANLGTVRYRLTGETKIATGEDFLPAFTTRFDREGSCLVER
jgi:LEA14-like dessication related protein